MDAAEAARLVLYVDRVAAQFIAERIPDPALGIYVLDERERLIATEHCESLVREILNGIRSGAHLHLIAIDNAPKAAG